MEGATWQGEGGYKWPAVGTQLSPPLRPCAQAMQFDVDLLDDGGSAATSICYSVWVSEAQGGTGGAGAAATLEGCLTLCATLARFRDPQGYCPTR